MPTSRDGVNRITNQKRQACVRCIRHTATDAQNTGVGTHVEMDYLLIANSGIPHP